MKLLFDNIILNDDIGWFFSNTFCALFKVNTVTGDILKIIKIKGNLMVGGHCYSHIKKIKNKLVLLPINGNTDVVIYDVFTEKLSYISIGEVMYNIVMVYHDEILLYDYQRLEKLIAIDVENEQIKTLYLKVKGEIEQKGRIGHFVNAITWKKVPITIEWENSYCVFGKSIFVSDGRLIELNLERKEVRIHDICDERECIDICRIENCFWILTNRGEVLKWSINKEIEKCIQLPYKGNHFLFNYKKDLYIITEQFKDFYWYNSERNRIEDIKSDSPLYEMERNIKGSNPFFLIVDSNDGLFLQQVQSGKCYKITVDDYYHYQSFHLKKLESFKSDLCSEIFGEYLWFCFDDFIDCIKILDNGKCGCKKVNDWKIGNFLVEK